MAYAAVDKTASNRFVKKSYCRLPARFPAACRRPQGRRLLGARGDFFGFCVFLNKKKGSRCEKACYTVSIRKSAERRRKKQSPFISANLSTCAPPRE